MMHLEIANSIRLMNFSVGILQTLVKLMQVDILELITFSTTDTGILVKKVCRNTDKVRIPSVFNKLHMQLEQPYSFISHPRGTPPSLGLSTQKTINTSHFLDLHLQKKCHPYVHTFQTSRQLNL